MSAPSFSRMDTTYIEPNNLCPYCNSLKTNYRKLKSNNNTLRSENIRLKSENQKLVMENEQLVSENEQLVYENNINQNNIEKLRNKLSIYDTKKSGRLYKSLKTITGRNIHDIGLISKTSIPMSQMELYNTLYK